MRGVYIACKVEIVDVVASQSFENGKILIKEEFMKRQFKNRLSISLSLALFLTGVMPYSGSVLQNFAGPVEVNAATAFTTTTASISVTSSAAVFKIINSEILEYTTSPSIVKVTSKKPGYAHLVLKDGANFFQHKITVAESGNILVGVKESVVNATALEMSTTAANIKVDGTCNLSVVFTPINTSFPYVKWSSSNDSVAVVDSNGKVTGKAEGTAKITAKWNEYIGITTPPALTTSAQITVTHKDGGSTGGFPSDGSSEWNYSSGSSSSGSSSSSSPSSGSDKDKKNEETPKTTNNDYSNKTTNIQTEVSVKDELMKKYMDVNRSNWFYNAVKYVVTKGMMVGVSDHEFAPNKTVTRAMIVQALYNFEKKPKGFNSKFSDVSNGKWYYNAVSWAQAKGIVAGFEDGTFKPDEGVTREQMVVILYNYAKFKGFSIKTSNKVSNFKDGYMVSKWALEAMNWAVHNGIVSGMENGTLSPKTGTTRAQLATMLKKFDEKF